MTRLSGIIAIVIFSAFPLLVSCKVQCEYDAFSNDIECESTSSILNTLGVFEVPSGVQNFHAVIMTKCRLIHIMDGTFSSLPPVEDLDLSDNMLSALKKEVIPQSLKLKSLNLSRNRFMFIDPTALSHLTTLQHLDLSHNQLTIDATLVPLFNRLNQLETLDLSYLESAILTTPFNNKKLKTLILSHTHVELIREPFFNGVSNVEHLHMRNCSFSKPINRQFIKAPNLKTLDLSQNGMTSNLPINTFQGLSKLLRLNLSGNYFEELRNAALFRFNGQLKTLDLSYNRLSNVQDSMLRHINGIEHLNLSNNHLANVSPHLIETVKKLLDLDLSHNNISYLDREIFRLNRLLTKINLSGNKLLFFDHVNSTHHWHLTHLDISRNNIEILGSDILQTFIKTKDSYLDISCNRLRKLASGFFNDIPRNMNIALKANPWQCSCLNRILGRLNEAMVKYSREGFVDGTAPSCVVYDSTAECGEDGTLPSSWDEIQRNLCA